MNYTKLYKTNNKIKSLIYLYIKIKTTLTILRFYFSIINIKTFRKTNKANS